MSRDRASTRTGAAIRHAGLAAAMLAVVASCSDTISPPELTQTSNPTIEHPIPWGRPPVPRWDPPGPRQLAFGIATGVVEWHGPELDSAFVAARNAGAHWVRFTIAPSVVEPRRGDLRWARTDSVVDAAVRAGLEPLGLILNTPWWNTSAPEWMRTSPPAGHPHAFTRYPPADHDAWADQIGRIVEHFRDRVNAWEVWNEPDLDAVRNAGDPCSYQFWCGTPAQYARLLAVTAGAIRRADPSARVVLGGLAIGGGANRDFLRAILADPQYPAAPNFDIANFHHYGDSPAGAKALMDTVRRTLASSGAAGRPIWITETGSPAAADSVVLAHQSTYAKQIISAFVEAGAENVFWYRLADSPSSAGSPHPPYGLLSSDLTPKPAYWTFQTLARRSGARGGLPTAERGGGLERR